MGTSDCGLRAPTGSGARGFPFVFVPSCRESKQAFSFWNWLGTLSLWVSASNPVSSGTGGAVGRISVALFKKPGVLVGRWQLGASMMLLSSLVASFVKAVLRPVFLRRGTLGPSDLKT